jgi:hypothetical protein
MKTECQPSLSLQGYHIDAASFLVKEHLALYDGEDGVIFAHANTYAWTPLRAALTCDDVTRDDNLVAKLFNAQALASAVASVFDRALSFLMSHDVIPLILGVKTA